MRIVAAILIAISCALAGFSYWGINTYAGQHAFDEMAAIVPYSAGLLAAFFALTAAGLLWWHQRRVRR
jgi:hypothetical protein